MSERRRVVHKEPAPIPRVRITVDTELAEIIRCMREDEMSNRAIRRYARKFLGLPEPAWPVRYKKRY